MADFVRHPIQPETVDIKILDGLFIKRTVYPQAGMIVPQHAHSYDHVSALTAGAARVEADGVVLGDFQAPAEIVIKARVKHTFTTLVDGTVLMCIHRTDEHGDIPIHEEHQLDFGG